MENAMCGAIDHRRAVMLHGLFLSVFLLAAAPCVQAAERPLSSDVSVKYEFNRTGVPITLCPPQGYLQVNLESSPHGNDSLMFFAYSPITRHDQSVPLCGIGFVGSDLPAVPVPQDAAEVPSTNDQRVFVRFRPQAAPGTQEAEWITFFRLKNQTVRLTTFFTYRNEADKTWAEALHKEWRETLMRHNQEDVIPDIPLWNPAHPAQMSLSILKGEDRVLIPLPGKTRLIPPGDLWQVGANSPVAILQGPSNDLIRISFLDQSVRGRNPAAKIKSLRDSKKADFKRQDIDILKDLSGREDFTFLISVDRDNGVPGGSGNGVGYYGYSYVVIGDQAIEIEISSTAADPTGLETALASWRNTIQSANR